MARARTRRRFLSPKGRTSSERLSELERGRSTTRKNAPRREIPPPSSPPHALDPPYQPPAAARRMKNLLSRPEIFRGAVGGRGWREGPLFLYLCHPHRLARKSGLVPLLFSPARLPRSVPLVLSRGKPSSPCNAATLRCRIHLGGDLIRVNWNVTRLSDERFVKRLFNLAGSYNHPPRIAINRERPAGMTHIVDYRRISPRRVSARKTLSSFISIRSGIRESLVADYDTPIVPLRYRLSESAQRRIELGIG